MLWLSVWEAGGSGSEELKKCPPPFPCSPVIREWLWKKTQTEKKKINEIGRWKKLNVTLDMWHLNNAIIETWIINIFGIM